MRLEFPLGVLSRLKTLWLYEDGIWAVTEANGPLAPASKVWARTIAEDVVAHRRKMHEAARALKVELENGTMVEVFDMSGPADRYPEGGEDIPFWGGVSRETAFPPSSASGRGN